MSMATPAPPETPWTALAIVGLGSAIAPLDFAVNVAFPALSEAFALQPQAIRWVAIGYVMTYGILLLGCGALGDRWGHLRIFRWGLWLALCALLVCSAAPSYAWLLAGRVLQGVAVAFILSCAPALVIGLMGATQRTRALAIYGGMSALAGMLAPLAGGLAMALWHWPGVFAFRVPIVLLALLALPILSGRLAAVMAFAPVASEPPGALFAAPGLRRLLRLCRHNPDFVWLNVFSVVVQFCSFAVVLLLPFYLGPVHAFDSVAVGLLLTVWACGTFAGSACAPILLARMALGRLLLWAMWGVALGLCCVGLWSMDTRWPLMAAGLGVQGFALGVFQVAYADQVVSSLSDADRGVSGSLTWVTRTVGVVGGAVVWLWLMDVLHVLALSTGASQAEASASSVMASIGCAAGVGAVGALGCAYQGRRHRRHRRRGPRA